MDRRDDRGWVEVICWTDVLGEERGADPSGDAIYKIARIPTQTFKPAHRRPIRRRLRSCRTRRLSTSHEPVADSSTLMRSCSRTETVVVGIDEGQFFDEALVSRSPKMLAGAGKKVIVAGPRPRLPGSAVRADSVSHAPSRVRHEERLRCAIAAGVRGCSPNASSKSDELVVLGAPRTHTRPGVAGATTRRRASQQTLGVMETAERRRGRVDPPCGGCLVTCP
jgi:hypothetical protein